MFGIIDVTVDEYKNAMVQMPLVCIVGTVLCYIYLRSEPEWILCNLWWLILLFLFAMFGEMLVFLNKQKQDLAVQLRARMAEIREKSALLEAANQKIAERNKDITDSIRYAENIQRAILPDEEEIKKSLPDHFVLFQPKDIVSGDFYWFQQQKRLLRERLEAWKGDLEQVDDVCVIGIRVGQ